MQFVEDNTKDEPETLFETAAVFIAALMNLL